MLTNSYKYVIYWAVHGVQNLIVTMWGAILRAPKMMLLLVVNIRKLHTSTGVDMKCVRTHIRNMQEWRWY